MSESMPAPPTKSGGSGVFIAIAVIMLLAAGGLIYFGMGDKEPEQQPEPPKVAEKPKPRLDAPIPAPPEPEKEDAGSDAGEETKKVAKGPGGPNPCAGTCKGTAPAALRSALAGRAGASKRCYERALANNPGLGGSMMVAVKVGPSGQVCGASVVSDSVGGGVAQCVIRNFQSGTLPKPAGGCVDTQVPINFQAKKQ